MTELVSRIKNISIQGRKQPNTQIAIFKEARYSLTRCTEVRRAAKHVYSRHPRWDSISTRMSNLTGQLDEIIDASRPFDYPCPRRVSRNSRRKIIDTVSRTSFTFIAATPSPLSTCHIALHLEHDMISSTSVNCVNATPELPPEKYQ